MPIVLSYTIVNALLLHWFCSLTTSQHHVHPLPMAGYNIVLSNNDHNQWRAAKEAT